MESSSKEDVHLWGIDIPKSSTTRERNKYMAVRLGEDTTNETQYTKPRLKISQQIDHAELMEVVNTALKAHYGRTPIQAPGDHAEDVHMFLACQNSVSSEDGLSLPDQVSTVMRSQDISCFTESYSSADSQSPSSSTTEKSAEPRVSCLSMAFGLRSRISEQPVINPGYHSRRDDHDRRVQKIVYECTAESKYSRCDLEERVRLAADAVIQEATEVTHLPTTCRVLGEVLVSLLHCGRDVDCGRFDCAVCAARGYTSHARCHARLPPALPPSDYDARLPGYAVSRSASERGTQLGACPFLGESSNTVLKWKLTRMYHALRVAESHQQSGDAQAASVAWRCAVTGEAHGADIERAWSGHTQALSASLQQFLCNGFVGSASFPSNVTLASLQERLASARKQAERQMPSELLEKLELERGQFDLPVPSTLASSPAVDLRRFGCKRSECTVCRVVAAGAPKPKHMSHLPGPVSRASSACSLDFWAGPGTPPRRECLESAPHKPGYVLTSTGSRELHSSFKRLKST
mmetsp:Transcript_12977/g.24738  ORF Transcript_12977/g.24738 Transcript_12977/m.24738 type:complete len:521 (-) Transcript_12977:427-1989(-)